MAYRNIRETTITFTLIFIIKETLFSRRRLTYAHLVRVSKSEPGVIRLPRVLCFHVGHTSVGTQSHYDNARVRSPGGTNHPLFVRRMIPLLHRKAATLVNWTIKPAVHCRNPLQPPSHTTATECSLEIEFIISLLQPLTA